MNDYCTPQKREHGIAFYRHALTLACLILLPFLSRGQFSLNFECGTSSSVDAAMIGCVDSLDATIIIPGDTSLIDSILVEIVLKGNPVFWDSTIVTTSAGEVVVIQFPGLITNTGSSEEAAIYRTWVGPCQSINATTPVVDPLHYNDWQSMATFQVRSDFDCLSGTSSDGDILLFHACDTFIFDIDVVMAAFKDVSIIAPLSELGDADTTRIAIVEVNYIHNGMVTMVSSDTFNGNDNLGNNALLYEKLFSVPGNVDSIEIIFKSPDGVFSSSSCTMVSPFGGDSFVVSTVVVSSACDECCTIETSCDTIPDNYACAFDLVPPIPAVLLDSTVTYSGNVNLDSLAFADFGGSYTTNFCDTIYIIGSDEITGEGCPGDTGYVFRSFVFFSLSTGNPIDTCGLTYVVLDSINPLITCPPDTTLQCSTADFPPYQTFTLFIAAGGTASDDCALDDASFTLISEISDGLTCPETISRTYSVADSCGNVATCVQLITLIDTIPPTLTCPDDAFVECSIDSLPPYASLDDFIAAGGNASDDCLLDTASFTLLNEVSDGLTCPETITRTYSIADLCGNVATCVQIITVDDTIPPTFEPLCQLVFNFFTSLGSDCPADADITLVEGQLVGESESWSVGNNIIPSLNGCLFDNCTNPDSLIARVDTITDEGDSCDRTITVFFTILDECENESVDQFICIVNIHDDVPPSITCPDNVTVECDESTDPANTGEAIATDDCQVNVTITYSDEITTGQCPQEYTITRTWYAADTCGNQSSCTQIISVVDTTPPALTCPGDVFVECTILDFPPYPTLTVFIAGGGNASDNCGLDDASFTLQSELSDGLTCPETITRTYSISDSCGNIATCVQVITVNDTIPPSLTCPDDITLECFDGTDPESTGFAIVSDNCDSEPSLTYSDILVPGICQVEFTITRTWTGVDDCGNVTTCVQTIVVDDSDAPLLTVPDDITIQCGDEPTGIATAIDECTDVFVTYVDLQCSVTVEGFTGDYDFANWTAVELNGGNVTTTDSTEVTLTGPDGIGCNGLSTLFSIVIPEDGKLVFSWNYSTNDSDGPSFDPFGYNLNGTFVQLTNDAGADTQSGLAAALVFAGDVFAFEQNSTDCIFGEAATTVIDFFVFTCTEDEPADLCNYTVFRCWSATDECGNTAYGLQRIHVEDTEAPSITCPDDLTLECTESTDPESTGFATATDNCDTEVAVTYSDLVAGECPYIITRTWTTADSCGNVSTCVQTITVDDTTPPSLTCPPDGIFECGEGSLFFSTLDEFLAAGGNVSDNCGLDSASFTLVSGVGIGPCPTIFTFLYTVTDSCGNLASCVHLVTVIDVIPPSITCPEDVELQCSIDSLPPYASLDEFLAAGGNVSDNCALDSLSFTLLAEESDGLTCPETITRSYSIADFCGNVSTCVQTITVDDTIPPVITCSADITLECSDPLDPGFASATDNCDTDVEILPISGIVQGECPNEFIIFRTWTATDECGNSATCAQTVTIVDTTPPEISCPADLTWECDESIDPASTGTATASDNCDSAPSTSYGDITDPGSCLTITRIWTATDACGNSSTCAQIITVVDNTPPNIVCPPDATVECDEGTDPADTGSAAAADFCDPTPSIDYTDVVGPGICHTITRTWTATDACGNSSSCVQIISVEDNTPPTIFCPPDVTLVGGESTDPADTGTATASDNCDATPDITYSDNYIPGPCSMEFSISRTWTATDACGNTAQCTQTLDRDDEPPIPVCLASVVVSLNVMGMTVIPAEAFDGGSTDNCGTVYFKVKRMTPPDGFDCFYDGNSLYQFDDYIKFCCEDVGNENLMVILRVYDVLPVPGIVPDDYLVGHFADCMLEVEVQDKIPPQIICPSDLTISCVFDYDPDDLSVFGDVVTTPADREDICLDDPGNPYTDGITCVGIDGIAIDNCSVSVTDTAIFDIHSACGTGHILRIFTATDPGGLSVSCEQWITIINYTPFDESNISWPPDYTTMDICQVDLLDPEDLPAPHDFPVLEEDECELVTFTYQDLVFDFSNSQQACFKILRTWTVLDWCQYQVGGGEGIWTRTQVIKVVNTVGPEITLEEEVVVCTDDPGCGPGHVQLEVSAIDDCSGPEALRWTVGVDENNNGSLEQLYTPLFGENVLLNIQLPLGVHRILYSVEDFCGNVTTEEQYITMESCKPPSAKCLDLTTTLMPVDTDGDQQADWGMVTLWASDFDAGSDHACGNPVQVAFSSDPGDVSRVFDCEDLGVSLVELWVIDDNGNTDFCIVTLTIQDNFDVCPETNQQQAIVTGTISTSLSEHVPGVSVNLVGSNLPPTLTNDNGEYAFPPMPFGGAYRVEPILDTNHKKGISTLDLILLQKHLLGIQALDSPYKIIAGDANHSETLSAMDIVVLRRLILGITQVIPNNTSWRFVDALYQFSDPLNPLLEAFPETYEIGSLDGDMDVDFIAIKVGDMNGSAMSSILANSIETRQAPGMIDMLLQDQHLRSGETTTVEILCHRIGEIQGMQFTLEWNPQYMDITPIPGSALLTDAHWNIEHLHQGMLPVSWTRYDVDQNGNTTALLTLNVFAKKEISLSHVELHISEAVTPIEGLLEDGRMAVPKLVIHSWHTETELLMYQNQPNPFTHKTIIPVLLPEAMPLKLEVFSPDGKMVHREEINGNSGYNTFLLDAMMLQGQGVYTYTISTDTEYRTLRMIVVGE